MKARDTAPQSPISRDVPTPPSFETESSSPRKLAIRIDVGSLVTIAYADKPAQKKMLYFVDEEHLLSDLPERVQKELASAALQLPRIDSPLGKALKGKAIGDEAHIIAKRRRDIEIIHVEDLS